jgi:hypothetical protein
MLYSIIFKGQGSYKRHIFRSSRRLQATMIIRRQNGRVFYNLSMNMVVGILMNFSLVMRSKNTDLGSGLYLWRGRGGGGGGGGGGGTEEKRVG